MNPLLRTGLATLASKMQTPASRAMVAGQRSMSTDVPQDPEDLESMCTDEDLGSMCTEVPPDPKDLVLAPLDHHLQPVQLLAAALVVAARTCVHVVVCTALAACESAISRGGGCWGL